MTEYNDDLKTLKKHYNIPNDDFELLEQLFIQSHYDKLYPEGRVGESGAKKVRGIFKKGT